MKIFISWSGKPSHKAARALTKWLPRVLPGAQPWISSEDIKKGSAWYSELSRGLQESQFGIICVDRSNVDTPWLNFEAGALSNAIAGGQVAPVLFGMNPSQVTGPLSQFQMTAFTKQDIRRLLVAMAKHGRSPKTVREIDNALNSHWPDLDRAIQRVSFPSAGVAGAASKQELQKFKKRVAPAERDILRVMADLRNTGEPGPEPYELADECGLSVTKVDHHLEQLRMRGFVRQDRTRWYLAEEGNAYVVKSGLD